MFTPFAFVKTAASVTPPPSFAFLLDDYSGAFAGYSLRKLRSAYAGSAIRVRRSSDAAEQDIGFSDNVLDQSALTTFIGANSGFVVTWYDQSGNARDLTIATEARQPTIVTTGTVETSNSKPAIKFTNSNYLEVNASPSTIPTSFFTVLTPTNNTTDSYFSITAISATNEFMAVGNRGAAGAIAMTGNDSGTQRTTDGLATSNDTQYLATNINIDETNTGRKLFVNSTNEYTSTNLLFSLNTTYTSINRRVRSGDGDGDAKWTEAILYASSKSSDRSGIESNINNFYSIY
jgi:hypothetical protein